MTKTKFTVEICETISRSIHYEIEASSPEEAARIADGRWEKNDGEPQDVYEASWIEVDGIIVQSLEADDEAPATQGGTDSPQP